MSCLSFLDQHHPFSLGDLVLQRCVYGLGHGGGGRNAHGLGRGECWRRDFRVSVSALVLRVTFLGHWFKLVGHTLAALLGVAFGWRLKETLFIVAAELLALAAYSTLGGFASLVPEGGLEASWRHWPVLVLRGGVAVKGGQLTSFGPLIAGGGR